MEKPEQERNSEGTKVNWWALAFAAVAALACLLQGILDAGALGPEGTAAVVIGAFLGVAKMVADYAKSRPGKHQAMASKTHAKAVLLQAVNEKAEHLERTKAIQSESYPLRTKVADSATDPKP